MSAVYSPETTTNEAPAAQAPRICLERLSEGYAPAIQAALEFVGLAKTLRPGDRVFLKPNLTFPHYREGVMTSPECVEALVVALKDLGATIVVGESDGGGYNRFYMEEVFAKTGLRAMADRYGIRLVNLSKCESREIRFTHKNREYGAPLPAFLLDEIDAFITIPVPKVHANTGVSMSIKNQWGCIQEPTIRLKLHPVFAQAINAINRAMRVNYSIIDGRFGLNRNGPMRGDATPLGWLMGADNILAADRACCQIMGIDPKSIAYLRNYADERNKVSAAEYEFNRDWREFVGPRFRLRREFWDYPGYFAFRSQKLAWLAYHSPFAGFLHKLLYLFREKFYEHD